MLEWIPRTQEGYPRSPHSVEGLIPRAIICYKGSGPWVKFLNCQGVIPQNKKYTSGD